MSRLKDPASTLTGKDLELYQNLIAKKSKIDGMYRTLLNHPILTKHVTDLGTYLRFESTLEGNFREFVILCTAHKYKIEYEWIKHIQPAHEAYLKEEIIEDLKNDRPLAEPYHTIFTAVEHVANLENIPEPLQDNVIKIISIKGLLELVVLVGFYRMLAGVIEAFDVPLPQ